MADYVVRVEASTEEAEKKLKRVDQQVVKLDKGASIDIKLPTAEQTLSTLGKIASATAEVGKQALAISRAANIGPGAVINDLDELFGIVSSGAKKSVSALELLKRSTPQNILGNAFSTATNQATALAQRVSNVGYEIFGVTQSVGILRQAFSGLFNETIGREIRLQEALLRTRTTLASTADVAVNGKRITDPFEALMALEGPIDETLQNIRRRSLDIAGTTSEAIVQVFGVVASQVGAFGGDLKDAEDLAITFAGALGTIGMADPMLATQEIRSILTGNIDQNSVLARSLGLTNDQIQKAKTSTEGLVGYLTRRLAAFTAGQKLAAQGFAGIVSNIEEVKEEALRSLGKPILQPFLDSLTDVYERLQLVFDQILSIADGLGRVASISFSGLVSGIKAAPVLQGFDARSQIAAFDAISLKVAEIAVQVQTEVDKVRPIIAQITNEAIKAIGMISAGLSTLLTGFISFKWEQLKITAVTLSGIAQILNSTLIPLASTLLSVYGRILELPLVQFLSQLQASAQVLEKTGVTTALTLAYTIKAVFADAIKTALGWISTAADFIKTAITGVRDFIASSISQIGAVVATAGEKIVATVTQLITKIILLISKTIQRVGQSIIGLAATLQAQGSPILQSLVTPLLAIGTALNNVDIYARQATESVKRFGRDATAAFGQVRNAAGRAADATRNVGTTVGTFLVGKLKNLRGFLLSSIKSLITFQLTLFAIEKGAALILKAWSDITRSQKEISDQTKAELAVKRLSTVYADLGENASETAKKLREVNEEIVDNRITTLRSRIEELGPAYKKAAQEYSQAKRAITEDNKRLLAQQAVIGQTLFPGVGNATDRAGVTPPQLPIGATDPQVRDSTVAQARYNKAKAEYSKYLDELRRLEEFQERERSKTKDKDEVQILARERKEVENTLKEFRKEIEKELRDERFRTAQEVAKLEQSLVEERRRVERAELDRQLARQSEGLTGIQANLAQILGDYERGLFDAQTEAQRKQFEAVQARESLEKAVADYKLKLEEQTERIRKRVGEFNMRVSDYTEAQAKRENDARIKTAMREAAIRAEAFVLGPDESRQFSDAAVRAGVSSTQALALLKTPGVIESLGVLPGASYDQLFEALKKGQYGRLLQKPQSEFIQALNERLQALGTGAGSLTYTTAAQELGNTRFFQQASPSAPPKVPPFENASKENARAVQERRSLGQQILNLQQRLSDLISRNNIGENFKNTKEALSKTNLFTDLPSIQEVTVGLQDTIANLRLLQQAAASGSNKVELLTQKLDEFDRSLPRAIQGFVDLTPELREATAEQKTVMKKVLTDSFLQSLQTGTAKLTDEANYFLQKFPKEIRELFTITIATAIKARKQINDVAPILDRIERLTAVSRELAAFKTENRNFVRNNQLEILESLGQTAAGDSPLRQRGFEAEMISLRRTLAFSDSGLLQDPEGVQALEEMNDATRRSRQELGLFEESLKGTTQRIALIKDLAQTMVAGYRNMFMNLVQGGDIKQAFTDLAESIQERVVGAFMEYATRPIIDQMEKTLFQALRTPTPEELAQKQRDLLLKTNNTKIEDLNASITNLDMTIREIAKSHTGMGEPGPSHDDPQQGGWKIGGEVGQHLAAPVTKAPVIRTDQLKQNQNAPQLLNSGFVNSQEPLIDRSTAFSDQLQLSNETFKRIVSSSVELPRKFNTLQKTLGSVIQSIAGVAMGFAGAQQMSGGGTYDTLMGLAGIFGAISSITGMIGSLGSLGNKGSSGSKPPPAPPPPPVPPLPPRATGGPVSARTPYLVGERGMEVFVPENDGQIISNSRLRALQTSRSHLSSNSGLQQEMQTPPALLRPIEMRYESKIINNVEYVTADQFRKGMAESAERGRALALGALKNSVKVRRQVGV